MDQSVARQRDTPEPTASPTPPMRRRRSRGVIQHVPGHVPGHTQGHLTCEGLPHSHLLLFLLDVA